jgi:amino acid permease
MVYFIKTSLRTSIIHQSLSFSTYATRFIDPALGFALVELLVHMMTCREPSAATMA